MDTFDADVATLVGALSLLERENGPNEIRLKTKAVQQLCTLARHSSQVRIWADPLRTLLPLVVGGRPNKMQARVW